MSSWSMGYGPKFYLAYNLNPGSLFGHRIFLLGGEGILGNPGGGGAFWVFFFKLSQEHKKKFIV